MGDVYFDDKGIPIYRVTGGLPLSIASANHPDLIPYLRSRIPLVLITSIGMRYYYIIITSQRISMG